jgi:hypothetical protein
MKSFSQFIDETTRSLATIQSKRLGLVPDGHGGYHDKKTGEFIAKNDGGRLKFYNQNQVLAQKDPPQVRTQRNQQIAYTQQAAKKSTRESIEYERDLRERYISGEIFKQNEVVENINTGLVGKIIRRGTNYLICVTEDDQMFKSWIKDVVEYTEVKVDSEMRAPGKPNTLVGTTGYFKNISKLTPGALNTNKEYLVQGQKPYGINFINKYKVKSRN